MVAHGKTISRKSFTGKFRFTIKNSPTIFMRGGGRGGWDVAGEAVHCNENLGQS